MGNVFGKVPAYTTIGYWTQELGLSVYKESCMLKTEDIHPPKTGISVHFSGSLV